MSPKRRILKAAEAVKFSPATFKSFDRRPVNYYRDMITDESAEVGARVDEEEVTARIEAALAGERARLTRIHEADSKRQFEMGVKKGRDDASVETRRAAELLAQYGRVLQAEKQEVADRCEKTAIDLAFMLAHKILDAELSAKPAAVVNVVKAAIRQVLDCDQIRLRVNPDDFHHIRSQDEALEALLSRDVKLELRGDPEVPRGGCLVETEKGTLDARIESQLETLRATIAAPGGEG